MIAKRRTSVESRCGDRPAPSKTMGGLLLAVAGALAALAIVTSPAHGKAAQERCGSFVQAPTILGRWVKAIDVTVVEGRASCRIARRTVRRYLAGRGLYVVRGAIGRWRLSGGWTCAAGGSHAGCQRPATGTAVQFGFRFPARRADQRTCARRGPHFNVSLVACGRAYRVKGRSAARLRGERRRVRLRVAGTLWSCRRLRTTASDFTPVMCWAKGRRQVDYDIEGPA